MKWQNYVGTVEYSAGQQQAAVTFTIRAVSTRHALTKATRRYPDARTHEVTLCRCSEVNNDMCEACYKL